MPVCKQHQIWWTQKFRHFHLSATFVTSAGQSECPQPFKYSIVCEFRSESWTVGSEAASFSSGAFVQ